MDTHNSSDKIPDSSGATSISAETKVELNHNKFLQVEDSTLDHLPKHFQQLLKSLILNQQNSTNNHNNHIIPTQADLLMALIYCIALETGFGPDYLQLSTDSSDDSIEYHDESNYPYFWGFSYHYQYVKNMCTRMPINQDDKNKNLYTLKLNLINFSTINCLLVSIRSGEWLIVTLTPDKLEGRSVCLSIPRYVLEIQTNQQQHEITPNTFRNLKELSLTLKDKLFMPTRNLLMDASNKLYPGLTGLPVEILNIILTMLKLNDLQILSKCSWKLRCHCVDFYEYKFKPKNSPFGSNSRQD